VGLRNLLHGLESRYAVVNNFFCNVSINFLSKWPTVFHVFQLMLGKLKSPRNNLYPDLLHM